MRAEGEADTDFVGAAEDRVGEQAVDADAGEEDGERGKEGGELGDEGRSGDGVRDQAGEGGDVVDENVGVGGGDDAAGGGDDRFGIARVTHDEVAIKARALGAGEVGGHLGGFVQAVVFGVFDYADDFDVAAVGGVFAKAEVVADG